MVVELNREPRGPRENGELERDQRRRDSFTRRVKKAFSESPSPFAYFVCFAGVKPRGATPLYGVSSASFRFNRLVPARNPLDVIIAKILFSPL